MMNIFGRSLDNYRLPKRLADLYGERLKRRFAVLANELVPKSDIGI